MADQKFWPEDRNATQREDIRFRVLRGLAENPNLSQRGLAGEIGVSLGAANALLNRLIEAGLVEIGETGTDRGRFRMAYVLAPDGRAELVRLADGYLARRRAERDALQREIEALEAGFLPKSASNAP